MSAIAGFFNYNILDKNTKESYNIEILNDMKKKLIHRGPDGSDFFTYKGCALLQLNLNNGLKKDASSIFSIDGFTIVLDSDIYNTSSLQKYLENKGVLIHTSNDSEIILKGFLLEGADFINKLNGIFSVAIWDSNKNKLYLFRDRLGVKPLFYTILNDTIIFSSEIKGLFCYPHFEPKIDKEGLCEIFALGPAKSYGKGVFKDVLEVLPGGYTVFAKDEYKYFKYWELKAHKHNDNFNDTVEKISYLIKDAVCLQSQSDSIGCFLSGGVDSSLVCSIASSELKKKNKVLDTFSFEFIDNDKFFKSNSFQPSLDNPYVDKMVECLNSNHTKLICNNNDLIDNLYGAVKARDLPCMGDVESSLLYFCYRVAKRNKIVLTGECADEIFGGYPWFWDLNALKRDDFPWSYDMSPRNRLLKDDLIPHLDLKSYSHNAYKKTINETPKLEGEKGIDARRREMSYLNLKWFMATLIDRTERTSMYSSLIARVPFADHRIVEYMYNVPWEFKSNDGIVKSLLRKAGEKYLPNDILYRKKSPYPKTYDPTYEKRLSDILIELLNDRHQPINNFLDISKVKDFINSPSDYGNPFYGQLMAGPQLIAFMIQVNFFFDYYNIELI